MLKLLKIAAGIAAGASLLTLAGPIIGETIATMPPVYRRAAPSPIAELGLPYEDVSFPTDNGLILRGWLVPAGQPAAPAIIYAPATAHDQRSGLSLVPAFHRAGYHVLLFSYRGHGLSDGMKGMFTYGDSESQDVDAAVRFLRETRGIDRIALIGHSAGAASAILSAARNPAIGAVVAVAPFNCVDEVWQTSRPAFVPAVILRWTLWAAERYRGFQREDACPLKVVDHIAPRPLLIIHGTADQRITNAQARKLFAAAREPKALWMIEGATHQGIRSPVLDQLIPEVLRFLDQAWQKQTGVTARPGHHQPDAVREQG